MVHRVKTLIAATALATLWATCASAGNTNHGQDSGGSQILNGQVTLQTQWSNLNADADTVAGDVAVQGAAAGNMIDIMTMNNTKVQNNQMVGNMAAIGSNINSNINNIGGSVGIANQVICNGASVSTDPTLTQVNSTQVCNANDPSSKISATVTNVFGDVAMQGSAIGNTFEADSNARNFPIINMQTNNSIVASTINSKVYNVGGSVSMSSSAIGNTGQILHYNTN